MREIHQKKKIARKQIIQPRQIRTQFNKINIV